MQTSVSSHLTKELSTQGTTLVITVVGGAVADVLAAALVMDVGAVNIPFATCIKIVGKLEIIKAKNNVILRSP